jgi:uncharacterized protein YecT (DUF1311 family)
MRDIRRPDPTSGGGWMVLATILTAQLFAGSANASVNEKSGNDNPPIALKGQVANAEKQDQADRDRKRPAPVRRCVDSGPGAPTMGNAKICAEEQLDLAEQELDARYTELHDAISSDLADARESGDTAMDAPLSGQLLSLEESQDQWKRYRSSTCRYAYFQYFPGSMARLEELTCLRQLTERRLQQLEAISSLRGEPIDY